MPHRKSVVLLAFIAAIGLDALAFCASTTSPPSHASASRMMCGPYCLWLAAKSFNITTTLNKLRYFAETQPHKGTSLEGMLKALRQIGLEPLLTRTTWTGLNTISNPTILLLGQPPNGHYVFLERITPRSITIIDPPHRRHWSRTQFMAEFAGYAIVVCKDANDRDRIEKHITQVALPSVAGKVAAALAIVAFIFLAAFFAARKLLARKPPLRP